jgi:hypothetical protein
MNFKNLTNEKTLRNVGGRKRNGLQLLKKKDLQVFTCANLEQWS